MNGIYKIMLFIFLTMLAGCKDYYIKTIINPDGSLIRTVIIKTENPEINFGDQTFYLDSTWQIEKQKDSSSSKYIYTAKKEFESADKLSEYMKANKKVNINVKLEKNFRWFYTYYVYKETYMKTNPFDKIDIKKFLNNNEYKQLVKGEINDSLSAKLDEYLKESIFEEFFELLIPAVTKNTGLDKNKLIENKNEIKNCIDDDFELDCIIEKIEKIYSAKVDDSVINAIEVIEKRIENKFGNNFLTKENYEYEITMPGLLLSTNANGISGSTGHWKFDSEAFIYIDYTLSAESRVANMWALISTAVFGLLLIIIMIIPRKNR